MSLQAPFNRQFNRDSGGMATALQPPFNRLATRTPIPPRAETALCGWAAAPVQKGSDVGPKVRCRRWKRRPTLVFSRRMSEPEAQCLAEMSSA